MASSCNKRRPQHRHDHGEDHDRHRHRRCSRSSSNRFNTSRMMHFHNNTQTLAALVMFLAVLLMSHHQVVSEETLAPEPTSMGEFELFVQPTTPITEKTFNETSETEDHKVLSELSPDIQQADVNNDIFSTMVEVSPEIKMAPDFIDSQPGIKTSESTDNLEQSIRNSVKIEMEQNLESSPVLEILKDIGEPEIRQTLTEDLIESAVNQNDVTTKPEESAEAKAPEIEIVVDQSQGEPEKAAEVIDESEVFEAQLDGTTVDIENTRGARNLEIEMLNAGKNETSESSSSLSSSSGSSSSSESNSSENSQESHDKDKADLSPEEEGGETDLVDEPQKPSNELYDASATENTQQQNNPDTDDKQEQPEADLKIADTSQELRTETTTPISDIAVLGVEEHMESNEDEALSVVLDESLSSIVPNNEEETLLNMEQTNEKTSLDIIAAEDEEATAIPDESEHVVIKKVLDVKDIFDDVAETTVVPEVARDLAATEVVEVPPPTIVVEEVSVTERVGNDAAEHLDEDSHQNPTVVLVAEEQSPAVTDNDDVVLDKQKEELVNENEVETEQTSVTIKPENTLSEEANTQATSPPESQTEIIEQEANEEEIVDSDNTEVIKDEPTIEDNEHVQELEPQHHEHINSQVVPSTTESAHDLGSESPMNPTEEPSNDFHFASTTAAASDLEAASENHEMGDEIADEDPNYTKKGSRSVNRALIDDDAAATMFEAYPPQDAGQTFNGNLADESLGIGKALPVSTNDVSNRSTIIIILSSGTAFLFIVISVTIFLISFQRQHGTLDIEMQERSCGKDNLDEEDAETFAKLLEVELPPSVAIALEETEECL